MINTDRFGGLWGLRGSGFGKSDFLIEGNSPA